MPYVSRAFYATILTPVSFAAIYFVLLVMPNPGRWYYNMTASGFAPFISAILLAIYAVPGWIVCYALLSLLKIPKPPKEVRR